MSNVAKRTANLSLDLGWDWVKNYFFVLVPTVPAMGTWALAAAKTIPIEQAVPLTVFVFWAITSSLKNLSDLHDRTSVSSRVLLTGISGTRHIENGATVGLQVAFTIANTSRQLIAFEVTEIRTSIDGRINPNPAHTNMASTIPPNSATQFFDASVPVAINLGTWHRGEAEISIRYGIPGKLHYTAKRKFQVNFLMNTPETLDGFDSRML